MASFASEVSGTRMVEFFDRFGRFGGNMGLLKQLLTDDERMEAWVQSLLVSAPVEHITVPISYQVPPYAELNGTSFDWASDLFSDKYTWEDHTSVQGLVDRTPGDRGFLVKHFNKEMTSDQVIAWADANGYRVATHEEAVGFAKVHPDLQRQFPIVALGSSALCVARRCVPVLGRDDAKRSLVYDWFDSRWRAYDRFLLVRK